MSKYLKIALGAAGMTCGIYLGYQHGFASGHHMSVIGSFLFLLGGVVCSLTTLKSHDDPS